MELHEYRSRTSVRARVLKEDLIPYLCAVCGQEPFWNGKPMSLILDHINGVNDDHRIENLRFVCPNCDIQLDTYGSRNAKPRLPRPKKVYVCSKCGQQSKKDARSKVCRACADYHRSDVVWPTRAEVSALVESHGYRAAGRIIGVSDNAVRKYLRRSV